MLLSTVNLISTRGPSSSMDWTLPTSKPETCTPASFVSPPASAK
jgi:hypothetical protein